MMISRYLLRVTDQVDEIEALIADLKSGDDQTAEAAAQRLAQMGEVALEALLELYKSIVPDHRWWAIRSLSNFRNTVVSECLVSALSDPDPSIQYCAALSLRTSPTPQAIPNLIKALESKDRLLARLAGDALTAIGSDAIPALEDVLTSSPPASRGEAARSLAKMGTIDVIPVLYSAAEDSSSIVQYWVEEGLERLGVGMVFFKP
jgi:HEAT repeat protein